MKKIAMLLAAVMLATELTGCGLATATVSTTKTVPPIQAAVQKCSSFKVGDGGHSATLDGQGENEMSDATKVSIDQYACILKALKTPDFIVGKMYSTRALDGMQNAEWNSISATWTFHPSHGLDLILHDK